MQADPGRQETDIRTRHPHETKQQLQKNKRKTRIRNRLLFSCYGVVCTYLCVCVYQINDNVGCTETTISSASTFEQTPVCVQ